MKTLVGADEPEPESYVVVNTTATMTAANFSLIVTTGGYATGDPPRPWLWNPLPPYRTQAFVDKRPEIEDGH